MHFRIDNWYNTWSGIMRNDYGSHSSHDLYQALLGIEKVCLSHYHHLELAEHDRVLPS